jgi:RimJ/RimL family protein N-acetyltransferase
MVVRTERLLLRRWLPEDRAPLAAMNADPAVMELVGSGAVLGRGLSDDLAYRFEREWDLRGFGIWVMVSEDGGAGDGGFVGFCGLTVPSFLVGPATAEVGWRLVRGAWGRGYATEAARAAVAFGFSAEGAALSEILALVDPANARSLRVCEKLGMTGRPDRVHPGTGARVRVLGVERPDG